MISGRLRQVPNMASWKAEIIHHSLRCAKFKDKWTDPKHRYQPGVESCRRLQSANIEFVMKRLREPIDR
jgi:hypothetical protein